MNVHMARDASQSPLMRQVFERLPNHTFWRSNDRMAPSERLPMRMSRPGLQALATREGRRLKAYLDTKGILTIGCGHTSAAGEPTVTAGMTITRAVCDAIFARDISKFEDAVNRSVKVPLSQGEFDALVSICFNIGTGAFVKSSIVKRLNAGDRAGAAAAILMWNKPKEIMGRRKAEHDQFLKG
jgi:lysozyme